ncbi:MAG: DUF839 domain-containing protein [Pseudomonadota bacterium]|nr:DUF839 domain-containing protein [Pseudomonadota bacterium]
MKTKLQTAAVTIALMATSAHAGTYFEPLNQPNPNTDETSLNNSPFTIPPNYSQQFVASRKTLNASLGGDPEYTGGAYPASFGNWDMIDFSGENNEFIYIPHEVSAGAGVTRLNRDTDSIVILLEGNGSGALDRNPNDGWDHETDDFIGLDPAVITPSGTLVTGEEWGDSAGRLFELRNPETATSPADADWRWLSNIPSISHEGIKFDKAGNMYMVDEDKSGSIYKFVPRESGDYSIGQTFVLSVDAYTGNADENYDSTANQAATRTGSASWIAITNEDGTVAASGLSSNPFDYSTRGGRTAADEISATPYGRPEDLTMNTANDNEYLLFATTSENIVYGIELLSDSTAMVREFVNSSSTPDLLGNNPVGTGTSDSTYGLDDPDNLATDAAGNVFIIEDEHPGDIWQAVDADKNGVAEHVALFASLGDYNSEPTGFKVDPRNPFTWYVNVQHPCDYDCNDALWVIKHDVADLCDCQGSRNHGAYVSCVSKAAKRFGIKGETKGALMEVAANSSCGK